MLLETYSLSRSTYIGGCHAELKLKHRLVRLYIGTQVWLGQIMRVHIGRHLVIDLSSKGQNPF
jgi:hypothetical protein